VSKHQNIYFQIGKTTGNLNKHGMSIVFPEKKI